MPILNGALLCDAAHDYNGLVSILGGFVNILYVAGFPTPVPIWYAARVAFDAEEVRTEEREIVVQGARRRGSNTRRGACPSSER